MIHNNSIAIVIPNIDWENTLQPPFKVWYGKCCDRQQQTTKLSHLLRQTDFCFLEALWNLSWNFLSKLKQRKKFVHYEQKQCEHGNYFYYNQGVDRIADVCFEYSEVKLCSFPILSSPQSNYHEATTARPPREMIEH